MTSTATTPLDLPRQVMRRAAAVVTAVLMLALALGLWRMDDDIDDEVRAAHALARLTVRLATLAALDDAAALAATRAVLAQEPLRHLRVQLLDADGRERLSSTQPATGALAPLLALHRRVLPADDPPPVTALLARPSGGPWTLRLQAARDSERAEAMAGLLQALGLLLLAALALLAVMRWNLRRAFAPLQPLLAAIGRIEHGDTAPVLALPPMPVHELERVAQALRHLGGALQATEAERRALGQRVITLQEDERARLARELHDEFGQHLTALRVDAVWLARRLQADPEAAAVAQAVLDHGQHIQAELRSVLARLRPLQGLDDEGSGSLPAAELAELLRSLVGGWSAPAAAPRIELQLTGFDGEGAARWLPAPLALALYRITQEALTNAARHAQAGAVVVRLQATGSDSGGAVDWSVQDDGIGIADGASVLVRGSGLAGMRERVWALGGELLLQPAGPDPLRPGLRLAARLTWGTPAGPGAPG